MDRRLAIKSLLMLMAGFVLQQTKSTVAQDNCKDDLECLAQYVIQIPEWISFDLGGVKGIRVHWKNTSTEILMEDVIKALNGSE